MQFLFFWSEVNGRIRVLVKRAEGFQSLVG
jgi:hypothetical protein